MNSYFIHKHTPDISVNTSHVINSPRTTHVTDEKMWYTVVNEHTSKVIFKNRRSREWDDVKASYICCEFRRLICFAVLGKETRCLEIGSSGLKVITWYKTHYMHCPNFKIIALLVLSFLGYILISKGLVGGESPRSRQVSPLAQQDHG